MLILLSPAKNLNYKDPSPVEEFTIPEYLKQSTQLINKLKRMNPKQIGDLMGISPKLSETNSMRYKSWKPEFSPENAKQAIFTFNGDVYRGLKADELSAGEISYAQEHLYMLSGLHGYLRPLDLIRPYRLEMGTKLQVGQHTDLYGFWGNRITKKIDERKDELIINLASKEYFRVIDFKKIKAKVITPTFKEYRNGKLGSFYIFLKQARGLMAKFVIRNKINDIESLKTFDLESYEYNEEMSNENEFVYIR